MTFLPFCEESIDEVFGEFQLRLTLSRPADAQDGSIDITTWATLSHLFRGLDINGIRNLFIKLSAQERDRVFQEQHAPALARNFVEQLRFEAILADGTTVPRDVAAGLHAADGTTRRASRSTCVGALHPHAGHEGAAGGGEPAGLLGDAHGIGAAQPGWWACGCCPRT